MIVALYVMLNVFAQMPSFGAPAMNQIFGSLNLNSVPSEITVTFSELNGIRLGSAVVSGGYPIGQVVGIEIVDHTPNDASDALYQVKLQIENLSSALAAESMVALQTTPVTAARRSAETVVELLPVPRGEQNCSHSTGETLCGYASYEKFWSAEKFTATRKSSSKKS